MFDKKRIDKGLWWDFGWKLVEGCDPVSEGCLNCWSIGMEKWLRKETGVVFHPERTCRPYNRKKPTSYAIWNDLFHKSISFVYIDDVFDAIRFNQNHIFMILTKRVERMAMYLEYFYSNHPQKPLENVWIGTTLESNKYIHRIEDLLKIPAKVHFVSCEPLLSGILIPQSMIDKDRFFELGTLDWVIAGPETGHNARPCKKEWIESLYEQCKAVGVPFFDKKDVLGLNLKQLPV